MNTIFLKNDLCFINHNNITNVKEKKFILFFQIL